MLSDSFISGYTLQKDNAESAIREMRLNVAPDNDEDSYEHGTNWIRQHPTKTLDEQGRDDDTHTPESVCQNVEKDACTHTHTQICTYITL